MSREVAEQALAHAVQGVERAYARSDLLELRSGQRLSQHTRISISPHNLLIWYTYCARLGGKANGEIAPAWSGGALYMKDARSRRLRLPAALLAIVLMGIGCGSGDPSRRIPLRWLPRL